MEALAFLTLDRYVRLGVTEARGHEGCVGDADEGD